MTFLINAWLDRVDPFIEIRHQSSGEVLAHFAGARLQRCLAQGDICINDLYEYKSQVQQELVRCLLLTQCAQCLQVAGNDLEDVVNQPAAVENETSVYARTQALAATRMN